jgi:hypothetical protein
MARTINIDEDVFAEMQRQAVPLVDTPDSLLRRLLGMEGSNGSPPRQAERQPVRRNQEEATSARARRQPARDGRAAKSTKPKRRDRAARGTIAPESIYVQPILGILSDNGGRVPKNELLDELGVRIGDQLLPADHEMMGTEERWRKRAQFVRLALIKQGLMKSDSPRGVWEITDDGRKSVDA